MTHHSRLFFFSLQQSFIFTVHRGVRTQRISMASLPTLPVEILQRTWCNNCFLIGAKGLSTTSTSDEDAPSIRTGLDISFQAWFSATGHRHPSRLCDHSHPLRWKKITGQIGVFLSLVDLDLFTRIRSLTLLEIQCRICASFFRMWDDVPLQSEDQNDLF